MEAYNARTLVKKTLVGPYDLFITVYSQLFKIENIEKSFTIHHRNLQVLDREFYKISSD